MSRSIPCRFFLEFTCNRGENCKFSHDLDPANHQQTDAPSAGPHGRKNRKQKHPHGAPRGPRNNSNNTNNNGDPSNNNNNHTDGGPSTRPNQPRRANTPATAAAGSGQLENAIKQLALDPAHPPPQPPPPPEPKKEDPPIQERIMGGYMSVRFGPGLSILSISSTNVTSPTALLGNLPPSTTAHDVWALVERFKPGLPQSAVRCMPRAGRLQAIVHFDELAAAEKAIQELDGSCQYGCTISARALKPTAASDDLTKIECCWFQPAKMATLQFFTAERAAAAADAAGKGREIRGRGFKCQLLPPRLGFSRPYSVRVVGLHVQTTEEDLKVIFSYDSVKMLDAKFDLSVEDTIAYIRSLFDGTKITELKKVSQPHHDRQRVMITVESADHARSFLHENQGKKHSFLGDTTLDLSLTYSATFRIPLDIYTAIKAELDSLVAAEKAEEAQLRSQKSTDDEKLPASFRIFDRHSPVTIHINGQGRPAVVRVKLALQKMLRGEILCGEDRRPLWDPALGGVDGKKLISKIKTTTETHIHCDARNRTLTLYGSPDKRAAAKLLLAEEYRELLNRQHVIPLAGKALLHLHRGGLAAVQDLLGADKVLVDLDANALTVRCSPAQVNRVHNLLLRPPAAKKAPPPPPPQGETAATGWQREQLAKAPECLICFDTAEDAVSAGECGHSYCRSCAENYLKSTLDTQKFPVTCVGASDTGDCTSVFSLGLIRAVLPTDDADRLFDRAFASHVQARHGEFHYCPTADCSTVYRVSTTGDVFTCPQCFAGVCTTCRVPAHYGQSCDDYQAATDPAVAERKLAEWKREHGVKTCPGCRSDVEKNAGCNHMECRCGTHWCWICGGPFAAAVIYDHMATCVRPPSPVLGTVQNPPERWGWDEPHRLERERENPLRVLQEQAREMQQRQRQREREMRVQHEREQEWLYYERLEQRQREERERAEQERLRLQELGRWQQEQREQRERREREERERSSGGGGFCVVM